MSKSSTNQDHSNNHTVNSRHALPREDELPLSPAYSDIVCEKDLMFSYTYDLVVILDFQFKILKVNPQWKISLGWEIEEILNQSFLSFVHPEDKSEASGLPEAINSEKGLIEHENRIICKDGSYRWIAWNSHVIAIKDRKIIFMSGRDITKNKEIEARNTALEKLYQMESLKMEFFANISHEFRTPLNIILSAIQLIEHSSNGQKNATPLCERHFRHLKSIKQNAYRLLRLVNNLIDISKVDSGYFKIYPSNHDIVAIVENITQSVAQYIEGKGISLMFDTDVEEKILLFDADMIERILLNLLSNAVKYIERNGTITVTINDLGNFVRVSVKDTGIGISEDKLNHIFERFIQGDKPLSRRCEGSGIGLSLVKALVELHNGNIYAKSKLNQGSEFIFELPVVVDQLNVRQGNEPTSEEHTHKINVEFSDIY